MAPLWVLQLSRCWKKSRGGLKDVPITLPEVRSVWGAQRLGHRVQARLRLPAPSPRAASKGTESHHTQPSARRRQAGGTGCALEVPEHAHRRSATPGGSDPAPGHSRPPPPALSSHAAPQPSQDRQGFHADFPQSCRSDSPLTPGKDMPSAGAPVKSPPQERSLQ